MVRQKTIPFSLALIDYHMPQMNGIEVIKEIRKYNKELSILAFSGDDSIQVHNESLDSGAIFFISKETAIMLSFWVFSTASVRKWNGKLNHW